MTAPRFFDCHSHWATAQTHIFRTPEELARQESIWRTKGRHWTEGEMMDYMRSQNARAILDIAFYKRHAPDEISALHDYAFDVARRNRDVIFGHWLQFDGERWDFARREFLRGKEADAGFVGFAIGGQTLGQPASDPMWNPYYELSIETNTPIMIMTGLTGIGQGAAGGQGIVLDDGHPRHIDRVAARYPELRILAARPAYPWQDDMIAVMVHKANVSYELHGWGPRQLSAALRQDIERRFGDRVMIGCDFPVLQYEKVAADWRGLGYSDDLLDKIMFRNADAYFR